MPWLRRKPALSVPARPRVITSLDIGNAVALCGMLQSLAGLNAYPTLFLVYDTEKEVVGLRPWPSVLVFIR